MITANELRIGNWVEFQAASGAWFPRSFEITDYRDFEDENTSYRAIPLTKEVLLKCGFKMSSGVLVRALDNDDLIYSWNPFNEIRLAYGWDSEGGIIDNVKHLHQLQNLYYALTGKELHYENS